ncbi:hypothetical protein Raf01_83970 [Rugosimonospora africana]|uniref:Uncharacterized protein n=1 Tax=Rugosimonospora africana TaxID=556532 RepID=A0A8J3R2L2_9ACTN|nr:hypothetical protein Raf01_83970 [Rugosimonospora africana]
MLRFNEETGAYHEAVVTHRALFRCHGRPKHDSRTSRNNCVYRSRNATASLVGLTNWRSAQSANASPQAATLRARAPVTRFPRLQQRRAPPWD